MNITHGDWEMLVKDDSQDEGFTAMEAAYVACIAQGMTQKEAAREVGRSPVTVKKCLERAYHRLGVNRGTAAVAKAQALGWIKYVGCLSLTLAMLVGADDGIRNRRTQRVVRRQEVAAIYA